MINAGKTNIPIGTRIKTTNQWNEQTVTGIITHPFGCFGGYNYGAVAGISIDKQYTIGVSDIGNLFKGDFIII